VAVGRQAGAAVTTGNFNTLIGTQAGDALTTGAGTVVVGAEALSAEDTESFNTAIGHEALKVQNGGATNTAVGRQAGVAVTTGDNNTILGANAGDALTTGSNNVIMGKSSAASLVGGGNNVIIGESANVATNASNSVVIGYGAGSGSIGSNEILLGNSSITDFKCQVSLTVLSDKRDKTNFETIPHGLDFVDKLKPTSYEFKEESNRNSTKGDGYKRYGFLAQEILELEGENPVIINNKEPEKLLYTESNLIPILVKAVQDLSAKVKELENK
jgi:hypothetical protein